MGLVKGVKATPWKVVLYGRIGIGKSSLAALAPGALMLDLEGGIDRVDGTKTEQITNWSELFNRDPNKLGILQELYTTGEYEGFKPKTLVFDTVTGLEKILEPVCIKDYQENHNVKKDLKALSEVPYGNGSQILAAYFSLVMDVADALKNKGINTLFVAHETTEKFQNPMGEDYDRYNIQCNKRAREILVDRCDGVLFAMLDTHVVEKDGQGFDKGKKRAVTDGGRIVKTLGRADFEAKNRFKLPDTIPMNPKMYEAFV